MGVVHLSNGTGIIVFMKSGSTSVRKAVEPWTVPPWEGLHHPWTGIPKTVVAVVRNPWARAASRWIEKKRWYKKMGQPDVALPLDLFIAEAKVETQSQLMQGPMPPLLSWEGSNVWSGLSDFVGSTVQPQWERKTDWDWRNLYALHPDAIEIVRSRYAADFELGIEWEEPCTQ